MIIYLGECPMGWGWRKRDFGSYRGGGVPVLAGFKDSLGVDGVHGPRMSVSLD